MESLMNNYTLKFKDSNIEIHYQAQTFSKQLKPLYYVGFFTTLLMNIIQIIINENTFGELSPYNLFLALMTTFNMFILYYKDELTQISLTLQNAALLILQLNFVDQSITKQEYFAYGSMYASLQTCLCFVTDFQFSCPSIIVHIIFRVVVQISLSGRINFVILGLALMGLIFLVYVLYICNRAQRLQYLMTVKDDTITKQLETLINAPFSKIKYDAEKIQINVQISNQIDKLIGYSRDLCYGCNVRNFLRNCTYQNQTLENSLHNKTIQLNKSFTVVYNKRNISIRICQFNIDDSLIFIQEHILDKCKEITAVPQTFKSQLKKQFSQCQSISNRYYKYGVMTLLTMNNTELKTINVTRLISKLILEFPYLKNISHGQDLKITTFSTQFQIFLLQVFNIISEFQSQCDCCVEFIQFESCLVMKLSTIYRQQFIQQYNSNYFIQQIQKVILVEQVTSDLEFAFKKYISFYT